MKKLPSIICLMGLSFLTLANSPEIENINVSKNEFSPGDSITVTIEFSGEPTDISSVELFSREYYYDAPELKMQQLEDKNVWILKGNVPYDTPSGTHHLEIQALNKEGEEIVDQCSECEYGKTGVVEIKVN